MNDAWSDDELRAAVDVYLEMLESEQRGEDYSKADLRRAALARPPLAGRSGGSFEYRMQNISAVLADLDLGWIPGYKPAANVGPGPRKRIIEQLRRAHERVGAIFSKPGEPFNLVRQLEAAGILLEASSDEAPPTPSISIAPLSPAPRDPAQINDAIRIAAITHVEALKQATPDGILSWSLIDAGFEFRGQHLHLANRSRGIFWPAPLGIGALSIKTVIPREGRLARYDDAQIGSDAPYFEYRYQGDDPQGTDNVRLRQCLLQRLPIIYFYGVSEAHYRPILCHVVGEDPTRRTFHVAPVEVAAIEQDPVLKKAPLVRFERDYAIRTVKHRLHQDRFRAAVLDAYSVRCAVCRLRDARLLDAAHIIPDREVLGEATVPNGLALCKLHHAAFDSDLMGISPDLQIHLTRALLEERDGPMLEHGLRGFHGHHIAVPTVEEYHPDPDRLAHRFERFQRA